MRRKFKFEETTRRIQQSRIFLHPAQIVESRHHHQIHRVVDAPPFVGPERPAPAIPEIHSPTTTLPEKPSLGPKDDLPSAGSQDGGIILDTNSQLSHPKVQPNDSQTEATPESITETDSGPVFPRSATKTQRQSTRLQNPSEHQRIYHKGLKAFAHPSETGKEQDRKAGVIRRENNKVEELQDDVAERDGNFYKSPFKGEEEEKEKFKEWVKENFEKRRQVQALIERAANQVNTKDVLDTRCLIEYCQVSKGRRGPPWEDMVIIGGWTDELCKLINQELKAEETDTWFLKGFKVRAELRKKIKECATGTVSSDIIQDPSGIPIYGQDLQSVPTLCGLSCHVRGSDNFLDSYFTIGGVLLINQKFFALTSAHPFQERISRDQQTDSRNPASFIYL